MAGESHAPIQLGNRVTALAAAAAGVTLDGPQVGAPMNVLISNPNATPTAVAFALTAAAALANAVVPTSGAQSAPNVIVMMGTQSKSFTVPPGYYWSASAAVYLLPGYGI